MTSLPLGMSRTDMEAIEIVAATLKEATEKAADQLGVDKAQVNVTVLEDNEIRRITRELHIEHADFIRARGEVREHLAVLRHNL